MCSGVKVLSSVEATSKSVWKSLLFKLTKNLKKKTDKAMSPRINDQWRIQGAGGDSHTPPPPVISGSVWPGPSLISRTGSGTECVARLINCLCQAICYLFKNLKRVCVRINWIPKIMVQFCYLRLYLGTETISCRLLQRMASMDMDWN